MKVALGLIIMIAGGYLLYSTVTNQPWLAQALSGQLPVTSTPTNTTGSTTTNPNAGVPAIGSNSGIK